MDEPIHAAKETKKRVSQGGVTYDDMGYDIGQDEEAGSSATRGNDRPGKLDESGARIDNDEDKNG